MIRLTKISILLYYLEMIIKKNVRIYVIRSKMKCICRKSLKKAFDEKRKYINNIESIPWE